MKEYFANVPGEPQFCVAISDIWIYLYRYYDKSFWKINGKKLYRTNDLLIYNFNQTKHSIKYSISYNWKSYSFHPDLYLYIWKLLDNCKVPIELRPDWCVNYVTLNELNK